MEPLRRAMGGTRCTARPRTRAARASNSGTVRARAQAGTGCVHTGDGRTTTGTPASCAACRSPR
eukprot:1912314-Alexandrium_andersonii.AAC.1